MTFDDILEQVITLLKRQGRVSYRAIKVRFDLNDDHLEAVKDELIYAQQLARDEDDRVLVCHGLGMLYGQTGQSDQARGKLNTAIEMYREMEMTFWLPETEAKLVDVEGKA